MKMLSPQKSSSPAGSHTGRITLARFAALLLIAAGPAGATPIADDDASNYAGAWTSGSNPGTGFLAWTISNNDNGVTLFAGSFIGTSTAGAGNIDVSGVSLGLYANPAVAFVSADRAFAAALTTGQTFSFRLALNYDNGNKGFNLFAGSQGEVFNFNVGSGGSVSSANATLTPGVGAGYNDGGNDAVLDVALTLSAPGTLGYTISRTSSLGFQGTLFSGNVTGLTDAPSGFSFYVSGTSAGGAPQNNLYINSLSVVPEPATALSLALGALACGLPSIRRRSPLT
jgi:hypothetical protein